MVLTRPPSALISSLSRPFARQGSIAARYAHPSPTSIASLSPLSPLSSRFYSSSGYGDSSGNGDPKGENPQAQGPSKSQDVEHPGPPPVSEGSGSGGATKAHADGDKPTHSSNETSKASTGGSGSSGDKKPQPKIHDERDGPKTGSSRGEVQSESPETGKGKPSPKIHDGRTGNPDATDAEKEEVRKHNDEFEKKANRANVDDLQTSKSVR
jgi:hypothetical protein